MHGFQLQGQRSHAECDLRTRTSWPRLDYKLQEQRYFYKLWHSRGMEYSLLLWITRDTIHTTLGRKTKRHVSAVKERFSSIRVFVRTWLKREHCCTWGNFLAVTQTLSCRGWCCSLFLCVLGSHSSKGARPPPTCAPGDRLQWTLSVTCVTSALHQGESILHLPLFRIQGHLYLYLPVFLAHSIRGSLSFNSPVLLAHSTRGSPNLYLPVLLVSSIRRSPNPVYLSCGN